MSRCGNIKLRRERLERNSAQLVNDAIYDINSECCTDLISFFAESVTLTLTQPIRQSLDEYQVQLAREGASRLSIPDTFNEKYQDIVIDNVQFAQQQSISLPPILVDHPPFITKEALDVQIELSNLLSGHYDDNQIRNLADQLEKTIKSTQEAYDMACIVAGSKMNDPDHPVFKSVEQMMSSISPEISQQISSWVDDVNKDLEKQATEAWVLTALGAAKLAVEKTGFDNIRPDISNKTITGTDPSDSNKSITIVQIRGKCLMISKGIKEKHAGQLNRCS